MEKFGDKKTLDTLMIELSQIKMENKERIKDWNKRFNSLLNKFPIDAWLTDNLQIGFYTWALPITTALFVKRERKKTFGWSLRESSINGAHRGAHDLGGDQVMVIMEIYMPP